MSWIKEFHGAKDFGHRRDDNLSYVGKSASGWWRAWVRFSPDKDFRLLDPAGYSSDQQAKTDADGFLDGKVSI